MQDRAILEQIPILTYAAEAFERLASNENNHEQKKTLALIASNLRATIVCARAAAQKTVHRTRLRGLPKMDANEPFAA